MVADESQPFEELIMALQLAIAEFESVESRRRPE
jgi:hypothetical protein